MSAHDERDLEIARAAIPLWEELGSCHGAPKMLVELRKAGIRTSRKRAARLMSEHGMTGTCGAGPKKPGATKGRDRRPEDLVKRDFEADDPNRAWFADITYAKTRQGRPYVVAVIDIWSRMAVGWAMGPKINGARRRRPQDGHSQKEPSSGLARRSDHGPRYRSPLPSKTMRERGVRPSMGPVDSPRGNTPTESFMGTLKRGCVHRKTFETREKAQIGIFEHIEAFYNRLRIRSAPGFTSPMELKKGKAEEEGAKRPSPRLRACQRNCGNSNFKFTGAVMRPARTDIVRKNAPTNRRTPHREKRNTQPGSAPILRTTAPQHGAPVTSAPMPNIGRQRITRHSMRHSRAMHLLEAG